MLKVPIIHLAKQVLFPMAVVAYTWPSLQHETVEKLLYEGIEPSDTFSFSNFTRDCVYRRQTGGSGKISTVAAEWLRFAYHDIATHNVTDGTGGLDASIYYELDREENVGAGMRRSLTDLFLFTNKYVSRSDVIAMGVVMAVASCGGPPIPFRYGRVDALEPGRPGVPLPEEDLATHTESFRLQGFSPTEMIALVACGHTIGGVRSADFPDIVPDPSNSSIAMMDTTPTAFDHAIVSEYLNSSTNNPLVTASDPRFHSDERIFASDGNITMNALNSPEPFFERCSSLLGRLINTVPSNVALSDVVTLLPAKVSNAQITIIDSQLVFMTTLRMSYLNNTTPPDPHNVRMMWCDRRGPFKDCQILANVAANPVLGRAAVSPLTTSLGFALSTYDFKVPLATDRSISRFWFKVEDGSPHETIYDNGGQGYVIDQDEVIHIPWLGSLHEEEVPIAGASPQQPNLAKTFALVFGVRSESTPTRAVMHALDITGPDHIPPFNETMELRQDIDNNDIEGYSMWLSPVFTNLGAILTVDLEVSINGSTYTDAYLETKHLGPSDPLLSKAMSIVSNISIASD